MRQLRVRNFSSIEKADIELRPFTILVGPQASGKSLLSKLAHFFTRVMDARNFVRSEDRDPRDVKRRISAEFEKNFPRGAWGAKEFEIELAVNDFSAGAQRKRTSNGSYSFKITLSDSLLQLYSTFIRALRQVKSTAVESDHRDPLFVRAQEVNWKIHQEFGSLLRVHFQEETLESQYFIPAGRSFFTSLGKTLTVFEHSESLDPYVRQFGRFYSALKEYGMGISRRAGRTSALNRFYVQMSDMLGGRVILRENAEYVEAPDGRQIPFHILSSGQQELLPLWLIFAYLLRDDPVRSEGKNIVYIEEPEAHLFPESQAKVVELLVGSMNRMPVSTDIFITTHSPYVLSKINNLIKASNIGSHGNEEVRKNVAKVIPPGAWLPEEKVSAYAILNGSVQDIMVDGFIEPEYMDHISQVISEEFYDLLEQQNSK